MQNWGDFSPVNQRFSSIVFYLTSVDHSFRTLYPFFKIRNPLESSHRQLPNSFFRLKKHLIEQTLWAILVGCISTPIKYHIDRHPASSRMGWLFTLVTPSPTKKNKPDHEVSTIKDHNVLNMRPFWTSKSAFESSRRDESNEASRVARGVRDAELWRPQFHKHHYSTSKIMVL